MRLNDSTGRRHILATESEILYIYIMKFSALTINVKRRDNNIDPVTKLGISQEEVIRICY